MAIIIILFFLTILSKADVNLSNKMSPNSYPTCPENEKEALLIFKGGLIDRANRLASWDPHHHPDCCRWFGVVCDNRTGHVNALDLGLPHPSDDVLDLDSYWMPLMLEGEINPCLSDLKHLRYLDLSNNPFKGLVPYQLGNLSNLEYLNLGGSYYYTTYEVGLLYVENLEWLSGLSLLKYLDLSLMNLSRASNWLQLINRELPCLEELYLQMCQLVPPGGPPLLNVNLSSLAILDLFGNSFTNQMDLGWVSKLNSLVFLNLGRNRFDGPIPDFLRNMSSSLRHLDLSINGFNSSIPHWLYSFSSLQFLNLRFNQLQGDISSAIANMTSLDELALSWNNLEGNLPRGVGKLCKLRSIALSGMRLNQDISHIFEILSGSCSHGFESLGFGSCQLSGQLTDQLEHFKILKQLVLSNNAISGPIPTSLGQLANLERVYIDNNLLEGVVSEKHFANHTKLKAFRASGNPLLVLRVNPKWVPPFQLRRLELRKWHIGPSFPLWLRSQKHLEALDISNSRIADTIPSWFWRLSTQKFLLNLSTNRIFGPLPRIPQGFEPKMIDLSNNYFSGSLVHFLCHQLNETVRTVFLALASNLLSGELPDCWIKWPSLTILRLNGNRFTGEIPTSIGNLADLESLGLQNNRLHGDIPLSLKNCTDLVAINLANNELSANIQGLLGYGLPKLRILILRSNKFRGSIPDNLCALTSLQILDLADNKLFGSIPRCISKFTAMATRKSSEDSDISYVYIYLSDTISESASVVMKSQKLDYGRTLNLLRLVDLSRNNLSGEIPNEVTSLQGLQSLNLSGNQLTGKIPKNIGAMRSIETLDLSTNQLSGSLPESISSMTFLSHLNLSFNNLSGRIPTSTQLQGFDESCFAGNHLCGPPLKICRGSDKEPDVDKDVARRIGKEHEINWFYVGMPLGFVTGFWCVVGSLVFIRRWRIIYFRFLVEMWGKVCDFVGKF